MLGKSLKTFESVFLIAETASSHEGEVELACAMADAVKGTGAHAIKYQFQNPDGLLVPSHHKYSSFKELQFQPQEWERIISHCRRIDLPVMVEVFDEKSCELALELGIDALKLPTSDLSNPHMLQKVLAGGKSVILAVGGATEEEIDAVVSACGGFDPGNLILMHGFQSFPTKIEDTNFRLLTHLRERYDHPVGFADHVDAESELAMILPLSAIGYGASVIEKHITMDRSKKGRDHYSALNPDEMKRLADNIRLMESAYGTLPFGTSAAEVKYRELMKKKIVAARDVKAGETITLNDLSFRRSDESGLLPKDHEKVLGLANRDIPIFQVIQEDDVEIG